ncbi:unnamed protein product [Amoebophrya sp. A25]|nr:unnamed protein product [Amoebophrya sp. A25]|eukprot:GSA25T00002154001.1
MQSAARPQTIGYRQLENMFFPRRTRLQRTYEKFDCIVPSLSAANEGLSLAQRPEHLRLVEEGFEITDATVDFVLCKASRRGKFSCRQRAGRNKAKASLSEDLIQTTLT